MPRFLRSATADDHRRTESLMPSLDELAQPDGYAWALRALHGFTSAWEPPLFAALESLARPLALHERRKLPLLEADLRALGLDAGKAAPAPPTSSLRDVATALGAMYVLEGSTLGGRVIARHCAALELTPDTGMAYFHGYGDRTGAMWSSFEAVVDARSGSGGERDAMIDGARQCFGALGAYLLTLPREQSEALATSTRG